MEPRRKRSRARERGVAAAALAGALVLAVAAGVAGGDPESSARASIERLAQAGASAVRATWARMAVEEELAPALGEVVRWRAADELARADAAPRAGEEEGSRDFALLLEAARRAEWRAAAGPEGREDRAVVLADLDELVARRDGGPVLRARALSRAVRLAARLGERARASELFELARAELAGDEAERLGEREVSLLLLAGLALAPLLEEAPRAELATFLAERWCAGELALPGADPELLLAGDPPGLEVRDDPLRRALRERLQALAPAGDPRVGELLAARERARRARALIAAVGPLAAPDDGRWRVERTPLGPLGLRAGADGWRAAHLVDERALAARLLERVSEARLLPESLALELEGLAAPGGERVRAATPLDHGGPSFALRHLDARGILAAERRRVRLLRGALVAAALVVCLAGLAAARAMARERRLVELRARFVASVTHELRTPLASILMLAENLEQGRALDPERRGRYPALIRREAERLRRLVDDVLDAARLERGAAPRIEREPRELAPLAAELGAELGPLARYAGAELRFSVGELAERGCIDREALRRAAQNLVDNALKHGAAEGGPTPVEVELGCVRGRLRLAVRDHGPGVPRARREEAFVPFERLQAGAAPGAGLGLWIVRELARAHGGDAWLEDPPEGPGLVAVFEVSLDAPPEDASEARGAAGERGVA